MEVYRFLLRVHVYSRFRELVEIVSRLSVVLYYLASRCWAFDLGGGLVFCVFVGIFLLLVDSIYCSGVFSHRGFICCE